MTDQDRATPGVVLVTGARRGIGRAVAERFLVEGWGVAINDIDEEDLDDTAEALSSASRRVTAHPADVGDRHQVESMIADVYEQHGRIDVLVNNAGAIRFAPFTDYGPADFEVTVQTNLLGTFHCTQVVSGRWITNGVPGNIVNVSSVSAHQARPGHGAYGASKTGVEMLSKVAAMELASLGIRVNCVAPGGPIMTEFVRPYTEKEGFLDRVAATVPLGRAGEPEEVAGVVYFLATEGASYMTGVVIVVDGGVTLGRP